MNKFAFVALAMMFGFSAFAQQTATPTIKTKSGKVANPVKDVTPSARPEVKKIAPARPIPTKPAAKTETIKVKEEVKN